MEIVRTSRRGRRQRTKIMSTTASKRRAGRTTTRIELVPAVPATTQAERRLNAALAGEPCTDFGNLKRFVGRHGQDVRYIPERKAWLVWDWTRWIWDMRNEVERRARATIAKIREEAVAAPSAQQQALSKHMQRSEAPARVRAVIRLAQSEPELVLRVSQLDTEPWLLNVLNGTIDLRTGELGEHRREHLITRLAPVNYDPDACFGLWEDFLERVLPDPDVRAFVQRIAGYALTGDTREEKLFIFHGPEAAGKTTILEAIKVTLGDYATTAEWKTFLRANSGGVRNDVARLAGARLVVAAEVDKGQRLAAALVKQLTGGDTTISRFLYSEHFEFVPQSKLFLAGNHMPLADADDGGIWRRILVVPFRESIPESRRDPRLKAALCDTAETGAAILAWLVQGCRDWQRRGLEIPTAVREATDASRAEMTRPAGREWSSAGRRQHSLEGGPEYAEVNRTRPLSLNVELETGRNRVRVRYESGKLRTTVKEVADPAMRLSHVIADAVEQKIRKVATIGRQRPTMKS